MKIFYAVQATGNGHISRAMELIPHLEEYGTVDVFLSGSNGQLSFDLPIKYRSKGLSLFYNSTGGLNYWKMFRNINPWTIHKEINDLPVEKYDLVINDFEFITHAACARKGVHSIQMGHQASFQSSFTPRPQHKDAVGEWVLKNYARANHYIGLHFECYDDFIFAPVIKKQVLEAEPFDAGHVVVYLPSYSPGFLRSVLQSIKNIKFHLFSPEVSTSFNDSNITYSPLNKVRFNKSLIECSGIITGAGFETPSEALHLGKRILAIPTRGQYEQQCNAAALEKIGVKCLEKIDRHFPSVVDQWINSEKPSTFNYTNAIPEILNRLFTIASTNRQNHYDMGGEFVYDTKGVVTI